EPHALTLLVRGNPTCRPYDTARYAPPSAHWTRTPPRGTYVSFKNETPENFFLIFVENYNNSVEIYIFL
ncbi:MAG: hypothetical protein IKI51_02185, partial [Clostridia bacterium]|nr:hypothetical protein [Clostridia bacterium]